MSSSAYRPEIDGLRSVAVIPVILFHAGFAPFAGGYVGVDVFFVISGFLTTSILIRDLDAGRFSLLTFYERRARRILPALTLVVLCCMPFAWAWMLPHQLVDFGQSVIAVALFASNFLFWIESDYFAPATEEKPLLHTWSLGVEDQYYLVFPVFLLLVWRFGRAPVFWSIVVLSALSLGWSHWIGRHNPSANFYLPISRAWELLAGSLTAFAVARRGLQANSWLALLALLGLVAIVVPIFLYDSATPFPGLYAIPPVLGTLLVILFAGRGTLVHRALSLRPMVWIGLISYSAYLWHQPLFAFARLRTVGDPSQALMLTLCGLTLVLAYASWRFVEQPFRGSTPLLPDRAKLLWASGAALAGLVALSLPAQMTNGLPQRFDDDVLNRQAEIAALAADRHRLVLSGQCQFNRRGEHRTLVTFLTHWDCKAEGISGPRFAVFGDSHAADRAMALRLAGASVTHLGGAGCPALPSRTPPYCAALLQHFLSEALTTPHDYVVVANRFQDRELSTAYLQQVVDSWASQANQVLFFTAMPEFPGFGDAYARGPSQAAALLPSEKLLERFDTAFDGVDMPANVQLIDTHALFCTIGDTPCSPMRDGQPLLVDYGHLSRFGATLFGAELLKKITLE